MPILTLRGLRREVERLAARCRCSKIEVVAVVGDVPDLTQQNTFQILTNGETWFVACNGESLLMDSGAATIVSGDPDNDISIGTDGGAYLDISVFDTNFFVTNITQNANRTHDQAGFTTAINNVNSFIFDRGAATLLEFVRFNAAGFIAQSLATVQLSSATTNYILGDGAGLLLPPTEAAPDWILLVDAATGRLEKITPAALGAITTDCAAVDACLGISGGGSATLFLNEQGTFAAISGQSFGTDNQVPFVNAAGTDFDYSPNLTFSGTALSVDNSTVVFNESGADVDFRIESDTNANMVFVDAGNNRVGIAKASPGFTLDIGGIVRVQDVGTTTLQIWAGSATGGLSLGADVNLATRSANVRKVGIISAPDFANTGNIELFSLNSPDAVVNTLSFGGRAGGSNAGATELNFITNATPATLGGTVRMYIANDGKIGMGLTLPQTNLHLQESNTDTIPAFELEQLSTGDAALQFSIVGDSFALGIDNSDNDLFKISYAAAEGTAVLGTGDVFTLSSAGLLTTTRVSVPDGTAALPSIKVGDEENGLFSPAVGQISFTTSGVLRATFGSGFLGMVQAVSGSPLFINLNNTSNTASSASEYRAMVAGTSAGDPFASFIITSGASWSLGADNSDSDAFVISEAATLGTSNRLRIATGGAVSIPVSLQVAAIVNDTGLAHGTYTPTRSAEVNMDANVTMTEAQYLRVGNTVTVSGRFTADPTLTATATSFEITLPIASNIGAVEDVAGVAFCGTVAGQGAAVLGSVANDTALIRWVSTDVTSQSFSYTFSYQVL